MPAAIQCRDLRKTYDGKVEAVRGLNLEIQAGECFGLLGPNGAGKTTTIEILEGLLAPTSGEVKILGKSWREDEREMQEWLGIRYGSTRLSEKLTVRETLELFASFYREPRSSEEVLAQLEELTEKADSWVGKLSGGQRQRRWRWRRRWCAIQRFCFSMSPRLSWIPRAAASSGTTFANSSATGARFCSPRITWTKPSAFVIASPFWFMARSSPKVRPGI